MKTGSQSDPSARRSTPKVAIVILNWNGWKDTIECLESLYQINYPAYDVIVVDNGSTDQSISKIRDYAYRKTDAGLKYLEVNRKHDLLISEWHSKNGYETLVEKKRHQDLAFTKNMVVIKNERNYGFAEGSNIGIRYSIKKLKPEYLLLLNNDVIVDRMFLSELIKVIEHSRDSEIGIVGPKIYYYDFQGRNDVINFAGEDLTIWKAQGKRYGIKEIDIGQHENFRETDKIDGACMLIKREIFRAIGLLEPDYFAYWEETDFCVRAKREGYKIVYVPTARIWHKIASSIGGVNNPNRIFYMTRNRFLFVKRNVLGFSRIKFLIYFFCWDAWLGAGGLLKTLNFKAFLSFINGTCTGLRMLLK